MFALISCVLADWSNDMALTRVLAPIMFYVIVMVPIAIAYDLYRWNRWRD